jgi:hypothetical protein
MLTLKIKRAGQTRESRWEFSPTWHYFRPRGGHSKDLTYGLMKAVIDTPRSGTHVEDDGTEYEWQDDGMDDEDDKGESLDTPSYDHPIEDVNVSLDSDRHDGPLQVMKAEDRYWVCDSATGKIVSGPHRKESDATAVLLELDAGARQKLSDGLEKAEEKMASVERLAKMLEQREKSGDTQQAFSMINAYMSNPSTSALRSIANFIRNMSDDEAAAVVRRYYPNWGFGESAADSAIELQSVLTQLGKDRLANRR